MRSFLILTALVVAAGLSFGFFAGQALIGDPHGYARALTHGNVSCALMGRASGRYHHHACD